MLKTTVLLTLCFGCALTMSAQIYGCANSTVVNNLGAAGPSNFTVFSMGGNGSMLNINLATVTGSVGVANPGQIKESAPSVINGDIIVGSLVNTSGVHGSYGSIDVDDATVMQAFNDATNATSYFSRLPSTPGVQSQFPANGQITQNLTVTGTAGVNVVNLPSFRLDNGATLTLAGPAGTGFVINVLGSFNLHSGNIQVTDGVRPMDVVYNIPTPNSTVTTMVPTTAVGALLAPYSNINTMDSSSFNGEVIGGFGKTITLMSGTGVTNPCNYSGPPQ
jgi:hypothetical protein